jgi:hypothetical protein
MNVPGWMKAVGAAVLVLSVAGIFIGGGFPYLMNTGRSGDWSWWQYALAVPAVGVVAILGEVIAEVVFAPFFRWGGKDQPLWKRTVFAFLVLGVGTALVVVPVWLANAR